MARYNEHMKRTRQAVKMGMGFQFSEGLHPKKGSFILEMRDASTGSVLVYFERDENAPSVLEGRR